MDWLVGNSFFVLLLLVCVGMHLFGHGHGHGHGHQHDKHDDVGGSKRDDKANRGRKF